MSNAKTNWRAGDVVWHKPSGEKLVAAAVSQDGTILYPARSPLSRADVSDCTMIEHSTDEQHKKMVERSMRREQHHPIRLLNETTEVGIEMVHEMNECKWEMMRKSRSNGNELARIEQLEAENARLRKTLSLASSHGKCMEVAWDGLRNFLKRSNGVIIDGEATENMLLFMDGMRPGKVDDFESEAASGGAE